MTSDGPLTVKGGRTVSLLSTDMLEEEQYDMMVDSLDQLLALGFHPPPRLIRALFAIVLSTPCDIGSSAQGISLADGKGGFSTYRPALALEPNGPNSATIADAAVLLEKLITLMGAEEILLALPPHCASVEADEIGNTTPRSPKQRKRSSHSPVNERSRKRKARRARASDNDDDDDDDHDRDRDSDSASAESEADDETDFTRRIAHMVQSTSLWDVLAFDPTYVTPVVEKKKVSHREADDEDEGGTRSLRNSIINAEPCWRTLRILVDLWQRQRKETSDFSSLNLVKQMALHPSDTAQHRKTRGSSPRPSSALKKLLEIIQVGFSSPQCPETAEKTWKKMQRQRLGQSRRMTASVLLGELFCLADKKAFRGSVLVRGAAEYIFAELDAPSLELSLSVVRQSISDTWELYLSLVLSLSILNLEGEYSDKDSMAAFDKLVQDVTADKTAAGATQRMVKDLTDVTWLLASVDWKQADVIGRLKFASSDAQDSATDLLQQESWRLGKYGNPSYSAREQDGRGKRKNKDFKTPNPALPALALAAKLRSAEIDLLCGRTIIKTHIISIIAENDFKGPCASTSALATWCSSALLSQTAEDKAAIRKWISTMEQALAIAEKQDQDTLYDDVRGLDLMVQCKHQIKCAETNFAVLERAEQALQMLSGREEDDEQRAKAKVTGKKTGLDKAARGIDNLRTETADVLPSLSQTSTKTVETIELSSDSDEADMVVVRKRHKSRKAR